MASIASRDQEVEEPPRTVCGCKNSCQRVGKCPCRTENLQCTELCSCGTKSKPCKNKLVQQPTQEKSLQQQQLELEQYVDSLDQVKLKQLCNRLLCGHGGVGLAKSLLDSGPYYGSEPHMNGPTWCICGNCKEMGNPTENVCCQKRKCITKYEEFFSLCVNHMVLTLGILDSADTRADPVDYSPAKYRKIAYRHYILWNYGYLGRGVRRVIPSCVVWAIRHWYPSPTGVYMGFREY